MNPFESMPEPLQQAVVSTLQSHGLIDQLRQSASYVRSAQGWLLVAAGAAFTLAASAEVLARGLESVVNGAAPALLA